MVYHTGTFRTIGKTTIRYHTLMIINRWYLNYTEWTAWTCCVIWAETSQFITGHIQLTWHPHGVVLYRREAVEQTVLKIGGKLTGTSEPEPPGIQATTSYITQAHHTPNEQPIRDQIGITHMFNEVPEHASFGWLKPEHNNRNRATAQLINITAVWPTCRERLSIHIKTGWMPLIGICWL